MKGKISRREMLRRAAAAGVSLPIMYSAERRKAEQRAADFFRAYDEIKAVGP